MSITLPCFSSLAAPMIPLTPLSTEEGPGKTLQIEPSYGKTWLNACAIQPLHF